VRHWLSAPALAAIVLLGAWGCGGDDVGAATAPAAVASAPAGDEGQIRDVGDRFYAAYLAGDGATACSLLSAAAERQVMEDPDTAPDGTTCEEKLTAAARVIAQYYGPDPKVSLTEVAVSGDRATGVIAIAGQSQSVVFERENGEWKLGPEPDDSGSTTTP
jgi:hypothetical protein